MNTLDVVGMCCKIILIIKRSDQTRTDHLLSRFIGKNTKYIKSSVMDLRTLYNFVVRNYIKKEIDRIKQESIVCYLDSIPSLRIEYLAKVYLVISRFRF